MPQTRTLGQMGNFAELQATHRKLGELGIDTKSVEDGFAAMRTLGPRRDAIDIATGHIVAPGKDDDI